MVYAKSIHFLPGKNVGHLWQPSFRLFVSSVCFRCLTLEFEIMAWLLPGQVLLASEAVAPLETYA
jgi:hypothetical protein